MLGYAFMGEGPLARVPRPGSSRRRLSTRAGLGLRAQPRRARRDAGALRLGRGGHRLARAGRRRARRPVRQRRPERAACRADDRGGPERQARAVREAARHGRGRVAPDVGRGRARRRPAHVRLQLPLRAGGAARARDPRGGRHRRRRPLPRHVPAELGLGGRRDVWRFDRAQAGHRRDRRPRRAHHRPRPLPRRRDRVGVGARADRRARAARSTTPSSRRSSSRTAPSARSRPRGSRAGGSTTTRSRSTARRARSPSTSSG